MGFPTKQDAIAHYHSLGYTKPEIMQATGLGHNSVTRAFKRLRLRAHTKSRADMQKLGFSSLKDAVAHFHSLGYTDKQIALAVNRGLSSITSIRYAQNLKPNKGQNIKT